jgi:hypothetical protein
VVQPLQACSPEEIQQSLPPLLSSRLRFDIPRWRQIVERRVQCYGDPDGGTLEDLRQAPEPTCQEPEMPVALLARLRQPDPNAAKSLPRELLMLVGVGLAFTLMIVALVYFAVK